PGRPLARGPSLGGSRADREVGCKVRREAPSGEAETDSRGVPEERPRADEDRGAQGPVREGVPSLARCWVVEHHGRVGRMEVRKRPCRAGDGVRSELVRDQAVEVGELRGAVLRGYEEPGAQVIPGEELRE